MASGIAIRCRRKTKEAHTFDALQLAHVQRRDEFSTVLSGGRLFQHYLVDQFCKMEAERLSCLLLNQQSSVLKTTQLFENCSETREAQMTSRRPYGPQPWLFNYCDFERDWASGHIPDNDLEPELARDSKISLTRTVSSGSAGSLRESIRIEAQGMDESCRQGQDV